MSLFKEAKYELSLALEEKEARKIEVMRERRKARMDRLLDPRSRTMGVSNIMINFNFFPTSTNDSLL